VNAADDPTIHDACDPAVLDLGGGPATALALGQRSKHLTHSSAHDWNGEPMIGTVRVVNRARPARVADGDVRKKPLADKARISLLSFVSGSRVTSRSVELPLQ
jgi:hypothetical protein